ncbi:zinc finger protein 862-like [Centruroides vittatus]|uniref:zinc finger protein 862-like n=1 Tax=Centruroides vittatus TaxID=120091 RepID=UPI00350F7FE4
MPKWKSTYDNNRKYNDKWKDKFPWIKKVTDGSESAYCKLCRCTIFPRLSNLSNHDKSDKHKKNTPSTYQTVLPVTKTSKTIDDKVKEAELQLSVSIACHSAIRSIDYVGEIIVKQACGSTLGKIKLHRTKCLLLLKNVISPVLKSELIEDLKDKRYVIIMDESTDVSTQKYLCLLVRCFSNLKQQITTNFLGLIPVQKATGDNIFNLVSDEIHKFGQSLTNCIRFVSDGASNMVGCNNSVWSRLSEVAPFCVQYKCICHSLALCIQYAVSKLPSNIGYLLIEIPK